MTTTVMTDASSIIESLGTAVPGVTVVGVPAVDMPTVIVDRDHVIAVLTALRDDSALQFALLSDLTAVDLSPAEPRFEVVYHLACLGDAFARGAAAPARRVRLKVPVPGGDAVMPSAVPVFPSANWLEREVYDLFGIGFDGHPDLRRILTPEDWTGHPLRKDYAVQIRKTAQAWSPIQLTPEEFAENVRAQRARAEREIEATRGRD